MYNAFMYIIENEGVDTESCYPYQGTVSSKWRHKVTFFCRNAPLQCSIVPLQQSTCAFNESAVGASISGIITIQSGSESNLLAAVGTTGPVSVAVDAHLNSFRVCQLALSLHRKYYSTPVALSVHCSTDTALLYPSWLQFEIQASNSSVIHTTTIGL